MKLTQISVFLENRKGRLFEACSTLGQNSINIRALTIAETDTFGVLRMVVDNPDEALRVLKSGGFVATTTEIVAVEVSDTPGGLAGVLRVLTANDINVEYVYGFVEKKTEKALLVFRFETPDKAIDVLLKNNLKVIPEADLREL